MFTKGKIKSIYLCLASLAALSGSLSTSAQMLTQKTKELGHGYRFQESQQVNVPGRWHSDRSFKFLYFEKRYLCQCTEFSISPSGKYAIYQIRGSNAIMSFNRDKGKVTTHDQLPKASLQQVNWGKQERHVELHLQGFDAPKDEIIKQQLKLK